MKQNCPIHGEAPCKCVVGKPAAVTYKCNYCDGRFTNMHDCREYIAIVKRAFGFPYTNIHSGRRNK